MPDTPPPELKVLFYNVHLFGNLGYPLVGSLVAFFANLITQKSIVHEDETRCMEIAQRIASTDADIVALSEVWAPDLAQYIISRTKEQLPWHYLPPAPLGKALGSGLLLLSRHPLLNVQFEEFKDLAGEDAMGGKGFIAATLNIPRLGPLQLIATHTQAGEARAHVEARACNIRQLYSALSSQPGMAVVCGDMNVPAGSEEHTDMNTVLARAYLQDSVAEGHAPTYEPSNELVAIFAPDDQAAGVEHCLDYFYCTQGCVCDSEVVRSWTYASSKGELPLSDHYPIFLRCRWSESAAAVASARDRGPVIYPEPGTNAHRRGRSCNCFPSL